MELFSLSVFIEDKHFGDEGTFIECYINGKRDVEELKRCIKPFIHRTLRKDVLEYIQYTNHEAITLPFSPIEKEQALYDKVSEFALNSKPNGCYVMLNLYGKKASIEAECDRLIKEMRQHAKTTRTITPVFTLSWRVE